MELVKEEVKEEEEEYLILGGDFNTKTGNKEGPIKTGEKKEEEKRRSKDKVINKEGRVLLNEIGERGWIIVNGSLEKEGDWTYIGETGTLMIDYVVTNIEALEKIIKIEEGDRTESDYVPLEVELEGKKRQNPIRDNIIIKEKCVWMREGVEHYHKRCEGWTCTKRKNGEIWKELEEKVKMQL